MPGEGRRIDPKMSYRVGRLRLSVENGRLKASARTVPCGAARGAAHKGVRSDMTDSIYERADFDLRLQDHALLEEIELYSELIIVAARSPEPLSTEVIDRALGLRTASLADSS
jgi:hypothetical protein